MKETFRDSSAGDQLSASEYNKLKDAVEKLANEAPISGDGSSESNIGGMKGRALKFPKIVMVRITNDCVPRNSAQYGQNIETITDGSVDDGFNATLQVWDNDTNQWLDSPSLERLLVCVGDDAQGWRPLIKEDRIPVIWNRDAQAFVPLEKRESAVVMITSGPDPEGYYLGNVIKWDSDAEEWVTANECYIMDVGNGVG